MSVSPAEAIVLAGGQGTRLRSVLSQIPKVLAPIGGRPFLNRLLDWIAEQGIESVVLATGYEADAVENAARAAGCSVRLTFSRELQPLGTGGAIAQAFRVVRGDRVWVLNGDSFCGVDLTSVSSQAAASPGDAWIVAAAVDDASRFGTIELDGSRVSRFHEKSGRAEPGWINAGIYVLPRALMHAGASSIERDLFPAWASQGRLRAVAVQARFIDIGTPESFAAAESFFA